MPPSQLCDQPRRERRKELRNRKKGGSAKNNGRKQQPGWQGQAAVRLPSAHECRTCGGSQYAAPYIGGGMFSSREQGLQRTTNLRLPGDAWWQAGRVRNLFKDDCNTLAGLKTRGGKEGKVRSTSKYDRNSPACLETCGGKQK